MTKVISTKQVVIDGKQYTVNVYASADARPVSQPQPKYQGIWSQQVGDYVTREF